MPRKIIKLKDGILVEVVEAETPMELQQTGEVRARKGPSEATSLDKNYHTTRSQLAQQTGESPHSFADIKDTILKITDDLTDAWQKMAQKMKPAKVEVELGFGFETTGNVFIASATTNASIKVTIKWDLSKQKSDE